MLGQPRYLGSLCRFLIRHEDFIKRVKALEDEMKAYSLAKPDSKESIFELVRDLSNSEWNDLLLKSCVSDSFNGFKLPGFPPEDTQKRIVGASNRDAISQIWGFYSKFHEYAAKIGNPVVPDKRLLDFGTGWGRIYRFFIKDFRPENLIGIDIDKDFIKMCRESIPYGNFIAIDGHPPLGFDEGSFDYLTAYSVFSHLNKPIADSWIAEFSRLLKKGGMLFFTVLGKRHLEGFFPYYVKSRKTEPELPELSLDDFYEMYEKGQFIYSPSGGGGVRTRDIYGWTVISPIFAKNNWCQHFAFIDLIDDSDICRQNILIMQRK